MSETHPTMARVFEQTGLEPSALALRINASPQNVTNWSKRGISKQGAMDVSQEFGLSLGWILTGQHEKEEKTDHHVVSIFSGIEVIRRENTKKLIADSRLTRQEFADKAGINYGLLGHYIGKNPSKAIGDEIAQRIETSFDKPLNWLDHEHGKNEDLLEEIRNSDTVQVTDDMIEIPLYGVYFCCGEGDSNCEFQEVKGARRFTPSFFRDKNIQPENFKLVCASNGSMAPYINDKDEVGLNLASTEVQDGRVYAILLDGDRMFTQIFREAGGALRLHSFNADYPDRLVTAENHNSLIIVGEQVYRAG